MYDIVLEKVLIYDGSGGKPYRGNLAVEDGRIAAIGDCSGPARRVIHGEGLAAAPGLIDVHTHNDNTLLWDRQMASALYQGVTTQVTGMCGLGLIPSRREEIPHILGFYGAILGGHGEKTPPYSDIDQYLSLAEGAAVNVAAAVNHSALRIFAGGWNSVPYGEIAPVMKEELRRNLRMGAVGLSVGLDYFPACTLNVTTEELVDLAKVAAEEDALLLTHIRPAGYGIDPLAEMDQVAVVAAAEPVRRREALDIRQRHRHRVVAPDRVDGHGVVVAFHVQDVVRRQREGLSGIVQHQRGGLAVGLPVAQQHLGQRVAVHRFEQVVDRVDLIPFQRVGRVAGDEQQPHRGLPVVEFPGKVHAAFAGHLDVQQKQVERGAVLFQRLRQRFRAGKQPDPVRDLPLRQNLFAQRAQAAGLERVIFTDRKAIRLHGVLPSVGWTACAPAGPRTPLL